MKTKRITIPENWEVSQADSSYVIFTSNLFPQWVLFWENNTDGFCWHVEKLSESGRFRSGIYNIYKTSKQAIKEIK